VGAAAVNQAIKAIAITRGFVAPNGIDIVTVPAFSSVCIDGEERTAIKFLVELDINTLQNVIISVYITGREKELRSMLKEETLKKAQDGDLKSIEDICSLTWETVYRFVYYKVQNRQEAEDITQETYVKALSIYKKRHTNRTIYRILKNRCAKYPTGQMA